MTTLGADLPSLIQSALWELGHYEVVGGQPFSITVW